MSKRQSSTSRLRRVWGEYKGDIYGIGGILLFFAMLFVAAASNSAEKCVQQITERHPIGTLAAVGGIFYAAGFVSTFISSLPISRPKVARFAYAVPYLLWLIGAVFSFAARTPDVFDEFVGALITLTLIALHQACMLYEMRHEAQKLLRPRRGLRIQKAAR